MVIEVTGSIDRESTCYLAGENVNVKLCLHNRDLERDDVLAWICVQLHCDKVFPRNGKIADQSAVATFSVRPSREAVYSSKPEIILCNWNVVKGGSEVREKSIHIPVGLAPTFKGHFVRYNWHVQIAVQRIDKPIQTLTIPLKVLNSTVRVDDVAPVIENPFLRNDVELPSPLEMTLARIEEKTNNSKKMAHYDVVSEGELFASLSVQTGPFKLGDVILGCVEFPETEEGKSTCLQMIARVETVEESLYLDSNNIHVSAQNSTQITTAYIRCSHFRIPIRLSAVPTFTEQSVKLTYRVHFEFTVTKSAVLSVHENYAKATNTIEVQALSLNHPIFVHSCNPFNVGLVMSTAQPIPPITV